MSSKVGNASTVELFNKALEAQQLGMLQEAESTYKKLLEVDRCHYAAFANLGVLYLQKAQPGTLVFVDGIECLKKSLVINPAQPIVQNSLGNALFASGSLEDADAHYLAAVGMDPEYLEAYINRCLLLKKSQGLEAARDWFIKHKVKFIGFAPYFMCLGALFLDLGSLDDALEAFDRAVAISPGASAAWYNRGNTLRLLARHDEALTSYRRCLRLSPDHVEAMINMGVLQQDLKCFDEAVGCYDAALKLRPHAINAIYNRALALENMGRYDEAVAGFEKTLSLSPAYPYLVGRLHHARMQCCDWSSFGHNIPLVCNAVGGGFPVSVPFPFLAMSDDLRLQRQCAELFVRDKCPPKESDHITNSRPVDQRIRVGYFSADFRTHAVGFLTAGLFEAHDRGAFEIYAFSLGSAPEGDSYRARIARSSEHFIDASQLPMAEIVSLARTLALDIAVDLAGHTMDARTAVFAQRIAPIQVNYLGYPGPMGATYMDVILADDVVVPYDAEMLYGERVVRLPQTFQINDNQRMIGQLHARGHYGLPEHGLIFASFNTSYKINPPIFDLWCRLLLASPGSVLWLLGENDAQMTNLRSEAVARGVSAERLVFAGRLPYEDHLARYTHVDLVLDTLPFNGGTSTSDALWGGAPVLTCMGQSFASRMSASLLKAVALPELVTTSLADYEALGLALAQAPIRLKSMKSYLETNRKRLPLFDTKKIVRDIETAYRVMVGF